MRRDSIDKAGMEGPAILTSVDALRHHLRPWREAADRIALVPTMGALHAGHLSLVAIGKQQTEHTLVSIFVNPKQFAANEDFALYPRSFESDVERLAEHGVDAIFAPPAEEMYPPGFATTITLAGPATAGLEDLFRPTHFQGVATIVAKLLIAALPDIAIFGEKDFQQLLVIRRLAADLGLPAKIIGATIIRETDGLAMSSRNAYLSPAERQAAPALHRVLAECGERLAQGETPARVIEAGRAALAAAGFVADYLELRHAETLCPAPAPTDPRRLLAAAYLGRTRLIDNIAVNPALAGNGQD